MDDNWRNGEYTIENKLQLFCNCCAEALRIEGIDNGSDVRRIYIEPCERCSPEADSKAVNRLEEVMEHIADVIDMLDELAELNGPGRQAREKLQKLLEVSE